MGSTPAYRVHVVVVLVLLILRSIHRGYTILVLGVVCVDTRDVLRYEMMQCISGCIHPIYR